MSHYLHSKEKMSRSVLMSWHNMGFPCLKMYHPVHNKHTTHILLRSFQREFHLSPVWLRVVGEKCSCLRNSINVIKFGMCYHCMPLKCWEHRLIKSSLTYFHMACNFIFHVNHIKMKCFFFYVFRATKNSKLSFEVIIFFATYLYSLFSCHS